MILDGINIARHKNSKSSKCKAVYVTSQLMIFNSVVNLSRSKTIVNLPSTDTVITPASFHNNHPTFLKLQYCVIPTVS